MIHYSATNKRTDKGLPMTTENTHKPLTQPLTSAEIEAVTLSIMQGLTRLYYGEILPRIASSASDVVDEITDSSGVLEGDADLVEWSGARTENITPHMYRDIWIWGAAIDLCTSRAEGGLDTHDDLENTSASDATTLQIQNKIWQWVNTQLRERAHDVCVAHLELLEEAIDEIEGDEDRNLDTDDEYHSLVDKRDSWVYFL